MKYFFAGLLVLVTLGMPASATTLTYTLKATFDYDECTNDDYGFECEPSRADSYFLDYYDDLTRGDTSLGRIVVNTSNPINRPLGPAGSYYELGGPGRAYECDDLFGRSMICRAGDWDFYISGVSIYSKTSSRVFLGQEPFWEFFFDGKTGRAEFAEFTGASAIYYAYFDLSDVRVQGLPTVPLPATGFLLIGAFGGLVLASRRKSRRDDSQRA